MGSAWNQLEQMLTCAICLDKFKNPRLLPCQHSFCGDACMDGLVDYARRQIKCPECRAEHRIPYQGVQSLPLNVTLIRFLELHARITGEEPEPVPTFMEKCNICGEKVEGVARCAHCMKKVCPECKEAHLDLLRREIGRINGQSRRSIEKLREFRDDVLKKAEEKLAINHTTVRHEIESSCRRLMDDLQAKQRRLLEEVDAYEEQERKTLNKLKVAIVDELSVLESNLQLADEKLISNKYNWNDSELSECKELYNKTMEFVRLFDPEVGDFSRKIRFALIPEFEQLKRRLCELGELKFSESAQSLIANSFQYANATGQVALEICQSAAAAAAATSQQSTGAYGLAHSNSNTNLQLGGNGSTQNQSSSQLLLELPNSLMRSQSDHRLASQFQARLKQQEAAAASSRYGRTTDYGAGGLESRSGRGGNGAGASGKDPNSSYSSDLLRDWPRPSDNDSTSDALLGGGVHFKSAFMRRKEKERQQAYGSSGTTYGLAAAAAADDDDDLASEASYGVGSQMSARNVRFYEGQAQAEAIVQAAAKAPRVFDCREVVHAPLSGVPKLDECPQLQTRLHQLGAKAIVDKKHAEEEGKRDKDLVESARAAVNKASERIGRQVSEDEVEKQKQANKAQEQQRVLTSATPAPPASGRVEPATTTTTTTTSASSSPATPPTSAASALPGGRRSLYGQAVTERSRRQLSSAIQDAASYTARRRSNASLREQEELAPVAQDPPAPSEQQPASSSAATGSGTARKRTLRSTGRSMSKQSSSERQQSIDSATSGTPTSPAATQRRRRQLARADSSLASRQSSTDQQSQIESATTTTTGSQSKNSPLGSVGARNSSPPPVRSSLRPADQKSPARATTPTTTDDEEETDGGRLRMTGSARPEVEHEDTGTIRRAGAGKRHLATSSPRRRFGGASRQDSDDEDDEDDDDDDDDDDDEEEVDDEDDDARDEDAGGRSEYSPAGKRKSREFLPSSMNKLLDRSAQIRRDSQEQRTRGDSPQRTTGSYSARTSNYPTSSTAASSSAARSRTIYGAGRSQSRPDAEQEGSNQSIYTTASSGGRRSSNEDTAGAESVAARRPSGSSTDRTVISARGEPSSSSSSRYSTRRESRDSSPPTSYTSRFLARSRTSAALSSLGSGSGRSQDYHRDDSLGSSSSARHHDAYDSTDSRHHQSDSTPSGRSYLSSRDRFMQSAGVASSSGAASPSSSIGSYASRNSGSTAGGGGGGHASSAGITTHSEYLRNKFAARRQSGGSGSSGGVGGGNSSSLLSRSRSSGTFARGTTGDAGDLSQDAGDDETGSSSSRRNSLMTTTAATQESPIYSPKGRMLFKLGSRGSEPGNFTWPRGVAVGSLAGSPGSEIVVADSSNHRVQIFDSSGRFMNEIGSYGSAPGEFDCLAGVALNRHSRQYVVSDRYNHRVQIFDASGRFVRTFGEMGRDAGAKFNLPWGVACDTSASGRGAIFVCDKENHRVQVFDGDGQFVSKFGSNGGGPGQLQHPHYITVGLNKIILTDTNNHRVQVFDLRTSSSGRVLKTIGSEGSGRGEFKFPRGVAMDDSGHIIVGDSGNNRLQVFAPEGQFIRSIGTWGSAEGEFKGIEGVAVDSTNGNIFVCDRENHRIQVF